MKRFLPLLFAALLGPYLPASAQINFEYGGQTRQYYLDSPAELEPGAPLVFVLHGYGGTAWSMRNYSGWGAVAESEGIMVCYPQGSLDMEGSPHWNANLGISSTNDLGFLKALAEHLQSMYFLSPECTYSCGMSNGGYMSYSLACNHPETFRAVGSVTGAMSEYDFDNCNPEEVVPVIHLHGTADYLVSYNGGEDWGPWGDEGVPEIIDLWTGMMGTTQVTETELPNLEAEDESSVDFFRHYGAPGGQEFHHYRVNGGGHNWFGVWGNQDIQSTELLWDFFASHCSGEFSGGSNSIANAPSAESLLAFWNGEHVGILADSDLIAWDVQGRRAWQLNNVTRGTHIDQTQLQGIMMLQVIGVQGDTRVLRIQ